MIKWRNKTASLKMSLSQVIGNGKFPGRPSGRVFSRKVPIGRRDRWGSTSAAGRRRAPLWGIARSVRTIPRRGVPSAGRAGWLRPGSRYFSGGARDTRVLARWRTRTRTRQRRQRHRGKRRQLGSQRSTAEPPTAASTLEPNTEPAWRRIWR